jgi:hypothetical protein
LPFGAASLVKEAGEVEWVGTDVDLAARGE